MCIRDSSAGVVTQPTKPMFKVDQSTDQTIPNASPTTVEFNNLSHVDAFDIGSYRSAPPGLRIWGGPTVDNDDIKKLLPWLDWAYHKSLRDLDI